MEQLLGKMQDKIHEKIFYLNNGGCAKFAYYLSVELTNLGIPHKISLCDSFPEHLNEGFDGTYEVSHVLVYIPKIGYIDGYKTRTLQQLKQNYNCVNSRKYNLDKLKEYAFKGNWNYSYDTSQNTELVSIIKQYINEKRIARVNLPQQKYKTVSFNRQKVCV